MGKPQLFIINLSGDSIYFQGSNVEGSVQLELTKPKIVQGISIVLSGKAHVHWTTQRTTGTGNNRHTETLHRSDTQQIFDDVLIQLWGNGSDSQELAAGRYEFPFRFQFPSNLVLPTSFEIPTRDCYIRYSLLAWIQRSRKSDYTTIRAISVNEIVDINTPQLTAPLSRSSEKTLCCLCCASGPISLSVETDRGGYFPGESIAISIEVENHSNRKITWVQATLTQLASYYAGPCFLYDTTMIQKIRGPGIERGATSKWSNELLPIPVTAPSISSCRILKLSYLLTITINIPYAEDLNVTMPITIGSVPFQGIESTTVDTSVNPLSPNGINYSTAHTPVNIGLDKNTMGETQFAPVYGFLTG